MVKHIELSKGKVCLVDDGDYEWLNQWKWYCDGRGYASRDAGGRRNRVHIKMHRLIMNAPSGMLVDHENGDTLDNRRSNLRLATKAQNQRNCKGRKNTTSIYKGVCKFREKWQAYLQPDQETGLVHLGTYSTEEEAARAHDAAAIKHHKEFAHLNFPDERNRYPHASNFVCDPATGQGQDDE